MLHETLNKPYMEEPYEIASGIFHFRKYHRVETRLEVLNQRAWLLATGATEGANTLSDSQGIKLDEFFSQSPSAIQVYLGIPKPFDFYKYAAFNMQVALDRTRKKTGLAVGLFSGGAYYTAPGISAYEAARIERLIFLSPVLGSDTIRLPIVGHLLGKTANQHLERLRSVVETVSRLRGPENVIFYTGDNTDPLVKGDVVVNEVYKAYGNKVTILNRAYKGHVPPMNLLINLFKI